MYEDAPEPTVRADQVLVRVHACAMNHLDLFVRAGIPGMTFRMPHILGSDIAGEIVGVAALEGQGQRELLAPGLVRRCETCFAAMTTSAGAIRFSGTRQDGGGAAGAEYSAIPIPAA